MSFRRDVIILPTLLCAFVLSGFAGPAKAGSLPDLAEPLSVLRAVGPEGNGNAAASAAWKQVAASDVSALIPILSAMDGANDYALNWLRAAVEAIAGREAAAGKKPPLPELGKFLLETSHNPRARRLAFELAAQIDSAGAELLLPGMLNDPSLEIRHDAVQKLIDRAATSVATGNRAVAGLLFQQALRAARDVQQIELIAGKLNDLGQPVDLQKHFGFLTHWKIAGPFDNTGRRGFAAVYPPEAKLDLSAEYDGKQGKVRWQDYVTTNEYGKVDMNQAYGKLKEAVAYASADFFSERAQRVELRLGGKNSWKVWLNGKFLFGRDEYHTMAEIDQYPMPAELQPGRNTILVKVCQNEEVEEWTVEWEFQLRVTDSLGTPIAPGGHKTGEREQAGTRGTSHTEQ